MKTIFTTGQIAKICKVAPRTVYGWFDSGRLRGHRMPGSRDRRVLREHLIRFLKEHGMPLGELDAEEVGKVLIVGNDAVMSDLVDASEFSIEMAQNEFEAGVGVQRMHPDCVVIDFSIGRDNALVIAGGMRKSSEYVDTILIGLVTDEDIAIGFDRTIFNETFRKPFDVLLLAERVRTLVRRKKELD